MTITKATPADSGCYCDGHWGQYAGAHVILRATEFGYDDEQAIALAQKKLAEMFPTNGPELTDDEWEILLGHGGALDDCESWLNDNVAPDGYSFGWFEGEFYLWSDATWDEGYA